MSLCLILISSKCSCKASLFESVIGAKSRNETVDYEPFLCRICAYEGLALINSTSFTRGSYFDSNACLLRKTNPG